MRKKILIVNANKGMSFLLQTLLSPSYNLVIVKDVFEGVSALKRGKNIEMFILDADANTEECIDFISHIQGSWLYRCPGIILTNNSKVASSLTISSSECATFAKPFNPQAILAAVDNMVSPSPVLA